MAKIRLSGACVIVESSMKLEDVKTVLKYRPCALNIYADEKKEDLIFMVEVANNPKGSIGACVAKFGNYSANGYAQITVDMTAPSGVKTEEWVADQLATALRGLNSVESKVEGLLAEIKAEREAVIASIVIE